MTCHKTMTVARESLSFSFLGVLFFGLVTKNAKMERGIGQIGE